MTYRIVHKTTYTYKHPVSYGNHVAFLTPRSRPHHTCIFHELRVTPHPAAMEKRTDYFGNAVSHFSIQEPHSELHIEARSEVAIDGDAVSWPEHAPAWEDVAGSLRSKQKPKTPAQMRAAIGHEVMRRHERGRY